MWLGFYFLFVSIFIFPSYLQYLSLRVRIIVIALLSVASNITISHAQDLSTLDDVHVQKEGKWSLVSLVTNVTKQEKDKQSSRKLTTNVGPRSNPQERVLESYFFTDSLTHRYATEIDILYRLGVVKGCSENRFCPNNTLKRYELVSMLIGIISFRKPSLILDTSIPFDSGAYADVRLTDTYAQTIYQAKALGLLDALEVKQKGKFFLYPDAPVTDQETIMLIRQLLGYSQQPFDTKPITITKAQGAFLLVQAFDLGKPKTSPLVVPDVVQQTPLDGVPQIPSDTFTYWLMSTIQSRFS